MFESSNPSRERILQRIANALAAVGGSALQAHEHRRVFPPVGKLLERFQAECKGNLTECILCCHSDGVNILQEQMKGLPAGVVFAEDNHELREMLRGVDREIRWSSDGGPRESDVVTITSAHALIAQTGSVLVSSACGGRGASIIAPVHVVVARKSQLVADLEEALRLAVDQGIANKNSFVGVITGCSRTGDIEKLLVLGAHGPKRLLVLLDVEN